ncbi:MAG TPA: hypothetical protein VJL10_02815 [Anaerolineales bacterium]|nr:hypothetical protein [Anaerolineales bacterium]
MSKVVEIPTVELVQKYINKFNDDNELVLVENVLSELFEKYPDNHNLRDVLIKAAALNSLYSTNIYAIVRMAEHIVKEHIDIELQKGTSEVVEKIARIAIKGKIRNNYSFASKYCHWHQPEMYPIYDSYVDQLLWAYHNQHNFMEFKQIDLRHYPRYKEVIEAFRKHYSLSQFSFKELDKFLWIYGRA